MSNTIPPPPPGSDSGLVQGAPLAASGHTSPPPDSNGRAIAGFVLGILSFITPYAGIILGIVGIVLSWQGRKHSEDTGAPHKGLATAGFVLSIIGSTVNAVVWVLLVLILAVSVEYAAPLLG